MGLHSLRKNISIIPQSPYIFEGTIRSNLDPFEKRSDFDLWNCLEETSLKEKINNLPDQLLTSISNNTGIFSIGEKQLLCLARIVLERSNKIILLDEATANIDFQTDQLIQEYLKTKFKDCIIISVAHRLLTIADYDKIIVMNNGTIAEIGSPYELLRKKG